MFVIFSSFPFAASSFFVRIYCMLTSLMVGAGVIEYGAFRAPPRDMREVKSGNKTHTFRWCYFIWIHVISPRLFCLHILAGVSYVMCPVLPWRFGQLFLVCVCIVLNIDYCCAIGLGLNTKIPRGKHNCNRQQHWVRQKKSISTSEVCADLS